MPHADPVQHRQYQEKYRKEHKPVLNAYFKTYRQENLEVIREKDRIRSAKKRLERREEVNAYHRAYILRPETREKYLAGRSVQAQRRRARWLDAEGSYTTQEWLELKAKYDYRCLCCGRHESELHGPLEQDHVVPLSKGGTNWITNIQPLCETCNGMGVKGTKSTDYRSV